MRTLELLPIVWPGVVAGVAAALFCGALSVFVAARRMAFVTQGVSHAAMAGAGAAALVGAGASGTPAILAGACLLAAAVIGWLTARGKTPPDTAVGVVLVASMAAGALMLAWRADHPIPGTPRPPSWESLLFGSVLFVRTVDAAVAAIVAAAGLLLLWLARRGLVSATVDPAAARASGVRTERATFGLALLVGAGVVISVKLVGIVLATALLILPGAAALRASRGLRGAFAGSIVGALAGTLAGLAASFETDAPPGASAAAALTLWWAGAGLVARLRRREESSERNES